MQGLKHPLQFNFFVDTRILSLGKIVVSQSFHLQHFVQHAALISIGSIQFDHLSLKDDHLTHRCGVRQFSHWQKQSIALAFAK
jgi:hypothetical protein